MADNEQVWIWTLGPGFAQSYARRKKFSTDLVCSPRQLIDFYRARRVMHFDTEPHTLQSLQPFQELDSLLLSLDHEVGLDAVADFPNLAGGIVDDLSSNIPKGRYNPESLAAIHRRLKAASPAFKLFAVIYTMNFGIDYAPYMSFIDVVSLWVWDSRDLPGLDQHVERCRQLFPGKPIVLGLYVHDYCNGRPMPLDLVQFEFEKARGYVRDGLIEGYQVLGSYLKPELETPQVLWAQDFINDQGADEDAEAAWDAELATRADEIRKGKAAGIPAERVFADLRKKLS
jgi:hypothetical protein